jgi:hypothetical protein
VLVKLNQRFYEEAVQAAHHADISTPSFEVERERKECLKRTRQPSLTSFGHCNRHQGHRSTRFSAVSVRILDVTLDCRRTMDEHVSNAVARAIGKCLALRRSHDVRPAQMYQLYIVAVVPTTDYEASVWYAPLRMGVKRHFVALVRVKKLALRLILRSYKSVALLVLQSEARLQSASGRLHRRVLFHIMKLCALAPDYPLQR